MAALQTIMVARELGSAGNEVILEERLSGEDIRRLFEGRLEAREEAEAEAA